MIQKNKIIIITVIIWFSGIMISMPRLITYSNSSPINSNYASVVINSENDNENYNIG